MKSLRSDIKNNLRHESKKNSNLKLINSTIKSISKRGINDTTMSNVSQGAGLSQGLINFHFKSKESLLIETLKFISNEYLESFQKSLKKAGSDPRKRIMSIIDNDFKRNICNSNKIAVWYIFLSEIKFKPVYLQICKERDDYYSSTVTSIFEDLNKKEKNKNISAEKLCTSLLALTMGLWLDQLVDSDNFKRMDGKNICKNFVKSNFPKQFRKY